MRNIRPPVEIRPSTVIRPANKEFELLPAISQNKSANANFSNIGEIIGGCPSQDSLRLFDTRLSAQHQFHTQEREFRFHTEQPTFRRQPLADLRSTGLSVMDALVAIWYSL